jgi:tRNA(fMet)-specific endonuclease VapC
VRYLLDTNVVIGLFGGKASIAERIVRVGHEELCISAIVAHELYFGALHSRRVEANLRQVEALPLGILPLTVSDMRAAAELRESLARRATPIGPYDVLIAGQAVARDLTLVTHNLPEFSRVDGLRVEDWEA